MVSIVQLFMPVGREAEKGLTPGRIVMSYLPCCDRDMDAGRGRGGIEIFLVLGSGSLTVETPA